MTRKMYETVAEARHALTLGAQWAEGLLPTFHERSRDRSGAASNWAVLGNAGALLLCFNAALDRKICAWDSIAVVAWAFAIGLLAAYISTVLDHDTERRRYNIVYGAWIAAKEALIRIESENSNPDASPSEKVAKHVLIYFERLNSYESSGLLKAPNWLRFISISLLTAGILYVLMLAPTIAAACVVIET